VAQFADATSADIRTVIWAVGYQDDTSWLDISEAKGPDGAFLHEAGISPVKGIYFVGRPWQRNRASALIMGAGSDAELIVQRLLSDSE
jgi:putative flavoprotein involved in K+ transport